MASLPSIACVPMKLDCLVMNEKVAADEQVKVAPIAQPNYTFLRLDESMVQNDVLPFTDLHYTSPIERNQRLTDLGTGQRRVNRQGVYVSWVMPRAYRMGAAGTSTATSREQRERQGYQPIGPSAQPDYSAPDFRPVPTRWLIVRYLDLDTLRTPTAVSDAEKAKLQFQGWVLDSDRLSILEDVPLKTDDGTREVDLQTDFSPFVKAERENSNSNIEQQAEVFVGHKTSVDVWQEDTNRVSVDMSLLYSSNHLFADYQPHNSNVFSMIDEMTYLDTNGSLNKISAAAASYYVIGWHAHPTYNPFHITSQNTKRGDRMGNLAMTMKDASIGDASTWQADDTSADVLCHGAMYDVQWSLTDAVPDGTAQKAAAMVAETSPIAVGTSAADALMTLVKAHVDDDTGALKRLETDLIAIQTQILAQDEGVDANMQAGDLLESYSFQHWDGGSQWHLGPTDGTAPTFTPTADQGTALAELNGLQDAFDNNARVMDRLSWDLFSIWWKVVSGGLTPSDDLKTKVQTTAQRWTNLHDRNATLETTITKMATQHPLEAAKKGTRTPYSQRKDPTLLVGGVQAGWPHDYLSPLAIRVDTQTVKVTDITSGTAPDWGTAYDTFATGIGAKVPKQHQTAVVGLLTEFRILYGAEKITVSSKNCVLPLYHDQIEDPNLWRDRWTVQPWAPLFIEWQAEYYHIPYDSFSLDKRDDTVRWGIRDGVVVSQLDNDRRPVSGRCLILPQPTLSLATAVGQLLTNLGSNIPLKPCEIKFLQDQNNFNLLPFLSSTLAGLTPHLTTRVAGTHIKPTQRPRGEQVTATAAALEAGLPIGMGDPANDILGGIVGQHTSLTPYGNSVQLDVSGLSPFKPASHGQLRFTQINILDKFGRAICVLDPSPEQTGRIHTPICLSDVYACQTLDKLPPPPPPPPPPPSKPDPSPVYPNTVTYDLPVPECEYAQIPPSINQPGRVNLVFCKPDPDTPTQWMPMNDWETPIYGWVLMNYADYGMQFFLSDGTFYRELRFGGPHDVVASPPWTPYSRPSTPPQFRQLDLVIDALVAESSPGYLRAFYDMISLSFGQLQPANSSYAQYVSSVVGRPLALVNLAMSLELAAYPLENQSNVSGADPYTLLPPDSKQQQLAAGATDPAAAAAAPPPKQYSFPLQLGDQQRSYDGLLGFWKPTPAPTKSDNAPTPPLESSFDYTTLHTFWPSPKIAPNLVPITPSTLSLSPFLISPDELQPTTPPSYTPVDPAKQTQLRNAALQPVSALVDPFTSIHAFSATLPTVAAKPPHWAVEAALAKMTAFVHAGPVLLTGGVPGFSDKFELTPDKDDVASASVAGKIGLPALRGSDWRWLQPYPPGTTSGGGAGEVGTPRYMPLGLDKVDERPRFEKPPYTAVEGFLQLSRPLTSAEGAPSGGGGGGGGTDSRLVMR
ncbi:hypothetical protein BR93DRAFT_977637 [Coniochaeta sp. PMI_546]|nr:hypothetical protein BR93DRAFT_977637 [Coniochaeta sp. PMI_546]